MFLLLCFSVALAVPVYFCVDLMLDQYARGFYQSVALLSAFAVLIVLVASYLAREAIRPLRLAHLPILDFRNSFVVWRDPESTESIEILYDKIESAEITENLSKYSPARLEIAHSDGKKVSMDPAFDRPQQVVMEQFENRCASLTRRYAWQWSKLHRVAG